MVTIPIDTEEKVLTELEEIARRRETTVQDVAREALLHYLKEQAEHSGPSYSFIGIWHSGKHSLSREVEAVLEEGANRREGWSLPE
jgi:hypothetical protein